MKNLLNFELKNGDKFGKYQIVNIIENNSESFEADLLHQDHECTEMFHLVFDEDGGFIESMDSEFGSLNETTKIPESREEFLKMFENFWQYFE